MDFMKMMGKAKALQEQMQTLQEEIGAMTVDGTAGGGMVTVTLTGKGEMAGLKIDPSLLSPDEAEILEDLLIAAHQDAKGKSEAMMAEKTQEMMSGLGIPPGMKMPF